MTGKNDLTERRELITDLGGRTDYERDYTAILYSHAFRRLKHKTQVFYFPVNDHICTRLDHSLYVASTSSIICRCLNLNSIECEPTLASAIGLGQDIFTEADTWEELKEKIRDAIECSFGEGEERPKMVRLHYVRDSPR